MEQISLMRRSGWDPACFFSALIKTKNPRLSVSLQTAIPHTKDSLGA